MKIKKVELSRRQQVELEYATYFDSKPFMQTRCKIILMKAEGQASQNIADQLGISVPMVNRWVHRYISEGFEGLRNKPVQGAKPIMDASDEKAVREAIEKDRLSLMKAKEGWQNATGKKASRSTFRSFLSALAQDLDV